jgi:hypothetical protein
VHRGNLDDSSYLAAEIAGRREEFMEHITDAEALTKKAKREAVEFPTQLKEAVRAAGTRVRGVAAATGARVKQVAATAGSETGRAAKAAYREGRAKIGELRSACKYHIGQKPGRSFLVGVGFGFLVGLLTRK